MAEATTNFKIRPTDYLNIDHELCNEHMYEIRINNPRLYSQIRRNCIDTMITQNIDALYTIVYDFLTEGRYNGKSIIGDGLCPNLAAQIASQKALEVARASSHLLYKIIDIAIPLNKAKPIFMNSTVDGHDDDGGADHRMGDDV